MTFLISFLFFFIFGHFGAAIFLYMIHRHVFHGKLRRWPLLKHLARLHGLHHSDTTKFSYIVAPHWAKALLFLLILSIAYIHLGLAVGVASFGLLYMFRHWAIHTTDTSSYFFHHHDFHHHQNALKNFSGIYPFLDKIFGTFAVSGDKLNAEG